MKRGNTRYWQILCLLTVCSVLCQIGAAQTGQGSSQETDPGNNSYLPVIVEPRGKAPKLSQDNFRVQVDKHAIRVNSVSQDEVPIVLGIALDISPSMKPDLKEIREGLSTSLKELPDRAKLNNLPVYCFVATFNGAVHPLGRLGADSKSMDDIINAVEFVAAAEHGLTHLYYSANSILNYFDQIETERNLGRSKRVLVLVTDAEDNASPPSSAYEFRTKLQESGIQLFALATWGSAPSIAAIGTNSPYANNWVNIFDDWTHGYRWMNLDLLDRVDNAAQRAGEQQLDKLRYESSQLGYRPQLGSVSIMEDENPYLSPSGGANYLYKSNSDHYPFEAARRLNDMAKETPGGQGYGLFKPQQAIPAVMVDIFYRVKDTYVLKVNSQDLANLRKRKVKVQLALQPHLQESLKRANLRLKDLHAFAPKVCCPQ